MSLNQQMPEALGLKVLETIADRRGSRLHKVRRDGVVMALKSAEVGSTDTYDRSGLLVREAELLRDLGDLVGSQYIDHGVHEELGPWLLLRWLEGATISDLTKASSDSQKADRSNQLLPYFIQTAAQYAKIHGAGFLHGDVQVLHTLFEDGADTPTILDWGLGRRLSGENPAYKGGFVHYAAPEIAAEMLLKKPSMDYTVASEMYSIGSLMYVCYTHQTAVDYGADDHRSIGLDLKLEAVAAGKLRGFEEPFDALQSVIMRCLSLDPAERYASASDLLQALSEIQ